MNNFTGDATTSPSLLIRIRNPDDNESWIQFESIYAPIIQSYCLRSGVQKSDADDLTQEVLFAVCNAIRTFQYEPQKGRFRSWLASVTINRIRNFFKKNNRYRNRVQDLFNPDAKKVLNSKGKEDPQWTEIFVRRIFNIACQKVKPTVESSTWQCFEHTWIENNSPIEVAKKLGISIQSVYANKSRILRKLEKVFLELSDDFPIIQDDSDHGPT